MAPSKTKQSKKHPRDDSEEWPKRGACLKCFKHMLIDPRMECKTLVGKKNCTRCSRGQETCGKVPLLLRSGFFFFFFENKMTHHA